MPSAPLVSTAPPPASFIWSFATLAQDGGVAMPGNPAQSPSGGGTTEAPGTAPGGAPGGGGAPSSPFSGPFLLIGLVFITVLIISQTLGARRDRKRREEVLRAIGKHDKVQTIGGIVGTVVEIRGDDTVVLKVDENSNTRISFARSAIQQVLKSANGGGSAPGDKSPQIEVKATNQGTNKV